MQDQWRGVLADGGESKAEIWAGQGEGGRRVEGSGGPGLAGEIQWGGKEMRKQEKCHSCLAQRLSFSVCICASGPDITGYFVPAITLRQSDNPLWGVKLTKSHRTFCTFKV